MKAIHFGAGNIGRGFIGSLLYEAGYETVFIDVNGDLIDKINEQKMYHVIHASADGETLSVKNVSGINNMTDPQLAIDMIAQADIVTTAIGPNILPKIAPLLAKGLQKRAEESSEPLNIIACENMVGGSATLESYVYEDIPENKHAQYKSQFTFPNAAVDRIVPNQPEDAGIDVHVEPYYEWVVESAHIKGERPNIPGITYVSDLGPYIERKLFTVNTGHAVPAFMGYHLGFETIEEAMKDARVLQLLDGVLTETGEALIQTYGFYRSEHTNYQHKIIDRFKNAYISDDVTRVARGAQRKLKPSDRLIAPAKLYIEKTGQIPRHLASLIAYVLQYDYDSDDEARELQEMIKQKGYADVLSDISKLEKNSVLQKAILENL